MFAPPKKLFAKKLDFINQALYNKIATIEIRVRAYVIQKGCRTHNEYHSPIYFKKRAVKFTGGKTNVAGEKNYFTRRNYLLTRRKLR